MDIPHIRHILSKGEGLTIELKKATEELPGSLFETVCAFLNRQGGTILLGVDDTGEIIGLHEQKADQLCRNFSNLGNHPEKHDPIFTEKDVFEVIVPISEKGKTTTKIARLILDYFHLNASGTVKELAKKLNLSEEGIRYHIKKLKAQKKLVYIGSPRKGYWQVLEPIKKK